MDNNKPQNGHPRGFTPATDSLFTSPRSGPGFRGPLASSSSDFGTEPKKDDWGSFWTRLEPAVAEREPVQEPEPEPQPEPEPEAAPDPEPVFEHGLPDDPLYNKWNHLSPKDRKKREKSLVKKGLPVPGKDFTWPPLVQEPIIEEPEPEPEPVVEAVPEPEPVPEPAAEELEPQFENSAQPDPEPKPESPRLASFSPQSERNFCTQTTATGSSFLLSLLSNIRDNGAFSDLIIKCGSSTFNTHCCIVCPQSDFFQNATKDGSKEVTIIDHPLVIKRMLDYLYQEDYDDYELAIELQAQGYLVHANTASQECEVLQMMACVDGHNGPTAPARNNKRTKAYANAMMYVTAAKYAIRGLEDLAEKKLVSNLIH
ncbi:BTB/POZ domain-containing protein, partial [Aspergillus alliaceus]|uniref:BTB/POZ domain-containing protein n=1 Tax=Petromyces alliaceus TaxID=209559 RepID=UPI0012A45097